MPGQHKGARNAKLVREMYARDPDVSLRVVAFVIHFKRIGDVRRLYRRLGLRVPGAPPEVGTVTSRSTVRENAHQPASAPLSSVGRRAPVSEPSTRELTHSLEDAAGAALITEVLRQTRARAVADLNESILVGNAVRKLWSRAGQSEFSTPLSFFDTAAKFYINEHGRTTERLATIYLQQQRIEELERTLDPLERRREEREEVRDIALLFHLAGEPFTPDELQALLQLVREETVSPPCAPEKDRQGVPLATEETPVPRRGETLIELPDKLIERFRESGWIIGGRLEVPPDFFRSGGAS